MTEEEYQRFKARYWKNDNEINLSQCRFAFESPHISSSPPCEEMFRFARECGYKIPEKWENMYK